MNQEQLFALLKSINTSKEIVMVEIRKLGWETMADNGFKFEAVFSYRNANNCTLTEAKHKVENYLQTKLNKEENNE